MRRVFRNLILTAVLLGITAGCTWSRNNNSGPQVTLPPRMPFNPSPGAGGGNSAGDGETVPAPTLPNGQAGSDQGGIPLALQVLSPQDGSVVNTSEVTVTGTATPGAVVTINDDIIIVGPDGRFQSIVTLDQGPNIIEIVASDDLGNEQTIDLDIDYEP